MIYGIYVKATGLLKQIGFCNDKLAPFQTPQDPALGLVELPQQTWDYYVDVTVTPHVVRGKTAYPLNINKVTFLADDTDEIIITGLHSPTQVITNPGGFVDEVTDGEFRLSTDQAGQYTLTLKAIPYLNEEVTIEAIA